MAAMQIREVDWREVLFDLKRLNMKTTEIAAALGDYISERQLRFYLDETQAPSHWRGELILRLWTQKTGRTRDDAPHRMPALRTVPTARVVRK